MRLTLRTLLAYLDDILKPADAEELGSKIRESDYATALVHRIRSSMGRSRLAGPKVLGKGMAADPNTVAEYLDNTLAVERVPEFEKVCLESDMHLAEVASCHQVLTLVLGEPADVSASLRQRVYGAAQDTRVATSAVTGSATLRRRIDEATRAAASEHPSVVTATTNGQPVVKTDAPRKTRWLPIVMTLAIGFVATSLLLFASGWLMPTSGHMAQEGTTPPVQTRTPADTVPAAPAWPADEPSTTTPATGAADAPNGRERSEAQPPPVTAPPTDETVGGERFAGEAEAALPGVPATTAPHGLPADGRATDSSVTPSDDTLADQDAAREPLVTPGPAEAARPTGDVMSGDSALTTPPAGESADLPRTPAPGDLAVADAVGARDMQPADETATTDNSSAPLEAVEATVATTPRDIGRKIGDQQVLAIWDAEQQAWMRMPDRAAIEVDQRLRALPTFRPQILLVNGIQLTLAEQIDLGILESGDDGTPRIEITGGHAIFSGIGQDAGQVSLRVGQREITIQQGDPQSEFAVSVDRLLPPGEDPQTAERTVVIHVWTLSGTVGIAEADVPARAIRAGEAWIAQDLQPAVIQVDEQPPDWVSHHGIREIDRSAMSELVPKLTSDRSLTLTLLEISQSRRTDVKSLAARCLAALDRFEPTVEALGDRRQHPHWTMHYEQLCSAVDRDGRVGERVLETLKRKTGPDAEKLYRPLWGYTQAQLDAGGAKELVDDLEDESLEVRVVAIEALKRMTGMHLYYKPEQPLARRQSSVKSWQKRLESGGIRIKSDASEE